MVALPQKQTDLVYLHDSKTNSWVKSPSQTDYPLHVGASSIGYNNDKNNSVSRSNQSEKNPREYDELMDEHALHIFMVRNGKVLDETPEFESFKRVYSLMWGDMIPYLTELEIYCRLLKVKILKVNGSALATLVKRKVLPTSSVLVSCLLPEEFGENNDQNSEYDPSLLSNRLMHMASIKLQSIFRMRLAKNKARRLRIVMRRIIFIQHCVRTYLLKKSTKVTLLEKNTEKYLEFEDLQNKLTEDWEYIKEAGRVELHYNCLGADELHKLSISKYEQKENLQIGRIFRTIEPNVEVIYVSSSPLPDPLIKYYYKVLELVGVQHATKRVHFLVPEGTENLPPYLSLASKISYSRKTMNKIKDIVNERFCVIVPGHPTPEDIKLSLALQYPLLSGHPAKNSNIEKLQISKTILEKCELPVAPYSSGILQEQEVVPHLAKLIISNIHIDRWVFKMEGEHEGRGLAYFDITSVKSLNRLRKKIDTLEEEATFILVQRLLVSNLPKKLKIVKSSLYRSFHEYISHFIKKGGLIEASPSTLQKNMGFPGFTFIIEPDGTLDFLASYEKLHASLMTPCGYQVPQHSLPNINVAHFSNLV